MDSSNRIPAKRVSAVSAWELPEVREGQVIHAERMKRRDKKGKLLDINKDEILYKQLTAGQLNEISEQIYQEVFEQARQEGSAKGQSDGYRQGYNKGIEESRSLVKQQTTALSQVTGELNDILQSQDTLVEQALVNLAMTIAGAVIEQEISTGTEHILNIVRDCIDRLPREESKIQIFLSANDYMLLKEHTEIPEDWKLTEDSTLTAGGCRIASEHSLVEFTLEEQFQQAVNAIVEQRFAELSSKEESGSKP